MKAKETILIMVLASLIIFCYTTSIFAGETARTQVEFANGEILFPENKIPPVKIKDLKLGNFPEGTPEEILAQKEKVQKGKVYNGWNYSISDRSDTVYLILTDYDPATRIMKLFQISDNNFSGKPAIKLRWEGEYKGISEASSIKTSGGEPGSLYINKVKNGYKLQLRFENGNGVDLVPVAEIPASMILIKKEQEKLRVENGIMIFPEPDMPQVAIKDLKFNFSPDSPSEILSAKGKIFKWESDRTEQVTYLIPLEFDIATSTVKLLYVTNNKGTKYGPVKLVISGVYNGSEGSNVKPEKDKSNNPWAQFYIIPKGNTVEPRLLWPSGNNAYFFFFSELPV